MPSRISNNNGGLMSTYFIYLTINKLDEGKRSMDELDYTELGSFNTKADAELFYNNMRTK
tara:strand:- start:549 stop:728 length:180 start_codon:yes stop_codon:yes gene_type:complete